MTLLNVMSTLIQRRFVNVDSSIIFNVKTTLILGWLWKQFCSYIMMLAKLKSWLSLFGVQFRSNFVPFWNILGDYAVFKNSTSQFLFWSILPAITVVFSRYFMKVSWNWSEETSIFSKLQVYGNIHEGFPFQ